MRLTRRLWAAARRVSSRSRMSDGLSDLESLVNAAPAPEDELVAVEGCQASNGFSRRMVSPRSAPTEMHTTGTPATSSTRFT